MLQENSVAAAAADIDLLKSSEPDAWILMHLLCFFNEVQEHMLYLIQTPRLRWSQNGNAETLTADDFGIDPSIIKLLSHRLSHAIHCLVSKGWVARHPGVYSLSLLSVSNQAVQIYVLQHADDPNYWKRQLIRLVCCAFPTDSALDPAFGDVGRSQLKQVWQISTFTSAILPDDKARFVETLLSASTFSDARWKSYILKEAGRHIEGVDSWLSVQLLVRLATTQQKKFLKESVISAAGDQRTNASQGFLLNMYAEKYIQEQDFDKALERIKHWKPLDSERISQMENLVLQRRTILQCRILRYQGCNEEAFKTIRRVIPITPYSDTDCMIMSEKTATKCELLRELPEAAIELEEYLETLSAKGSTDLLRGRRIQLALGDVLISIQQYSESFTRFENVYRICSGIEIPSRQDKLVRLRSCLGMARAKHLEGDWQSAFYLWGLALRSTRECGWIGGHTEMLVRFGSAIALKKLKRSREHQSYLNEGISISHKLAEKGEVRNRWFPTVGTHFQDHIVRELNLEVTEEGFRSRKD